MDQTIRTGRRQILAQGVVAALGLPITLTRMAAAQDATPSAGGGAYEPGISPALPAVDQPTIPPELVHDGSDWPAPQGDLAATRNAAGSPISVENVVDLQVAWRAPLDGFSPFGAVVANPIVSGDTVYIQDGRSNILALDRASGVVRWRADFDIGTFGPNGVTIAYGTIFAPLGDTGEIVALDAATGAEQWRVQLTNPPTEGIDMAPIAYDGVLYVGTAPGTTHSYYSGGSSGRLIALDASRGSTLWEFDVVSDNSWGAPRLNGGGGIWYPPSIDNRGNLYLGTGNPVPWPGTKEYPAGSSRPGENLYTSAMLSLDAETGGVRWHVGAKPHDLVDHDFQHTPILTTVDVAGVPTPLAIGAGKTGEVIAANGDTGEVIWSVKVGKHVNDELQELPLEGSVEVYPGVLGGIESPIAFADGVVFATYVDLSMRVNAHSVVENSVEKLGEGTGGIAGIDAATGAVKWTVPLATMVLAGATVANDVVFTAGLDGVVRAFRTDSGEEVWRYQAAAGINAPFAIAGDMLLVPAGSFLLPPVSADGDSDAQPAATPMPVRYELIALRLGTS